MYAIPDPSTPLLRSYLPDRCDFSNLISKSNEQIKTSLLKIWEEVCLLEETENIDLKEMPEENWNNRKQKFWEKIFGENGEKKKRVAFIYDKNPVTSGWIYEG